MYLLENVPGIQERLRETEAPQLTVLPDRDTVEEQLLGAMARMHMYSRPLLAAPPCCHMTPKQVNQWELYKQEARNVLRPAINGFIRNPR